MRPFTHTLPFAEARRLVLETAVAIDRTETIRIADADGREDRAVLIERLVDAV